MLWSGCCSSFGCSNAKGCPRDAAISISIDPGAPWPPSLSTSTPSRVASGVGVPVTAHGTTPKFQPAPTVPVSATVDADPDVYVSISTTTPTLSDAITTGSASMATTDPKSIEVGSGGPSQSAIAGIGVGSAIGLIGLLFIIYLLCRYRKRFKPATSYREGLPDDYDEKDNSGSSPAGEGRSNADVFAPFGGKS